MAVANPRLHNVCIIQIRDHEFNVYCENTTCDFNKTTATRTQAKLAAYSHLTDLLAEVT